MRKIHYLLVILAVFLLSSFVHAEDAVQRRLAYLVSDVRIPFWDIMSRGIKSRAHSLGYSIDVYSADNIKKTELQNTLKAIKDKVDGLIISPINSSTAVTILNFAKQSAIPVVIADIGADSGQYVSYISSDNRQGAYDIGKVLVNKINEIGWQDGSVGIVSIPQERANGKARTAGFLQALKEAGIKSGGLRQQVDFSYRETYAHTKDLINSAPSLRAIWLQGSNRYQAALDAIKDSGKEGQLLLLCFDAEPEFLEMIPEGVLVGAAMQQPYLMGEMAVSAMDSHLNGKDVKQQHQLPILAISNKNIKEKLPLIRRNVLGIAD